MDYVLEIEQRVLRENPGLLSDQSLSHLRKYKYSSVDRSLLSYYVLNPFWTWCSEFMPAWLAPNCITLIGISAILLCNVLVLLFQHGDMVTAMPRLVYVFFGVALLFYQTMDNIDGKQARRTGTSSPLGELFDHGIDSLNCLWGSLIVISTMSQGSTFTSLVTLWAPMVGMYCSAWETFYTKTLFLDYLNAPTEGLVLTATFQIAAGIWGPEFWEQPLGNTGIQRSGIWTWPLLATVLFLHVPSCLRNVYRVERQRFWEVCIVNLWPLCFVVSMIYLWCLGPTSSIISLDRTSGNGHLFLFGWCLSFTFGRTSTTIILSHLCNSPKFPRLNLPIIMLTLGAVLFGLLPRLGVSLAPVSELTYLWLYFIGSAAYFFAFSSLVIDRITNYLGIRAFTIRRNEFMLG